jgi:tyrosyl-tRNA synthetase
MRNNADWLRQLGLMDFLRDVGKHFTLSYMLQKESVRSRMETGISYTEFSYMLVQAYDFWHLWTHDRCELQMGGSDQWGNITAGAELISRREGAQGHGLVFPLLTTAAGGKFGKSEDGNVWLDPARTSPYKFYQFWLNSDDRDVERLLRYFTFVELDEIAGLMTDHARDPGRRAEQRRLAEETTTLVHGARATAGVITASRMLFGGEDLSRAGAEVFEVLAGEIPTTRVAWAESTACRRSRDWCRSRTRQLKADARRGVQQAGFSLNGATITPDRNLSAADLLATAHVLLQKGKRSYALRGRRFQPGPEQPCTANS